MSKKKQKMEPYWDLPYTPSKDFQKKTAYFSMEFAVHQGLKIYSGGLGFLAGSHMRSAHDLKQNLIGIGMLWRYGYYDQGRNPDHTLSIQSIEKQYSFLKDTGLQVSVRIYDNTDVQVRAYLLEPETFGTAPIYLLSTRVPENDELSQSITDHLYDNNEFTRIAQSIVLGIGGAKIVELLGGAEVYHLNEGHGLPAFYYLKEQGVKAALKVFTTHTPERGGNEERSGELLNRFGFFGRELSQEELQKEMVDGYHLNYTVSALRMAKKVNAVSKLHAKVSKNMWNGHAGARKIIPITNAQHIDFWQDETLRKSWKSENANAFRKRKEALKRQLFEEVLNQTGKLFRPEVLTMVWARRFAEYKRADLLLQDLSRFHALVSNSAYPIQLIWAGKPYPQDGGAINLFNYLVQFTRDYPNLAVLTGYEIDLSKILKTGSDVWLNTPRITREASGTSGMTAAMNGSVNVTVNDGWIPEFAVNGKNSFVLPETDHTWPIQEQDAFDCSNLYDILENKVIPIYYDKPEQWNGIVFRAIDDVSERFSSDRMAREYYERMYQAEG